MGKSFGLLVAVRYQGRGNALRAATQRRTLAPVALYAAYGSNLDPAQMLSRCPHSPQRGTGWLEGWRLTFGGEDIGWDGALATVVEDPRSRVFVVLYDVSEGDEKALDNWDGVTLGYYRRAKVRAETLDDAGYIESLGIQCRIECLTPTSTRLERVEELFQRTTQFNTNGRKFSATELAALAANPEPCVFALDVSDRFGHHGLVGAAVVAGGEIQGLVISCRALGMGIEHTFLRHVLDTMRTTMQGTSPSLRGQIIPTARNIPVRNLYRDNGFNEGEGGVWECRL